MATDQPTEPLFEISSSDFHENSNSHSDNQDHSKSIDHQWDLDACIKLLETRKKMEETFVKTYQTSTAWVKLVHECGWTLDWKQARNKFANLKRQGIPNRLKKPKTGQEGSAEQLEKVTLFNELLLYFKDASHKYNPPRVIDTSAKSSTVNSDSGSTNPNSPNVSEQNTFRDSWLLDERNDEVNRNDEANNGEDSFNLPYSQTTSFSSYESSSLPDSYISVRQRKKIPTQRELMAKSLQNIKEISQDIRRYTDATLDFYEFLKSTKVNQNSNSGNDVPQE